MRLRLRLSLVCGRKKTPGAPAGPALSAAPAISGTPTVGQTLTCSSGTWTGTGDLSYAYQWRRDGLAISGATAATYTLLAEDDGAEISCLVTAGDDNGSQFAAASSVSVTYAAPSAAGGLSDQTYDQGSGVQTVDAAADFTGAVGGTWSVAGAGATINSSGVVSIPTADLLAGAVVTVTYTNSGGAAQSAFQVTVEEVVLDLPTNSAAPTISGTANVGQTLSVSDGTWSGTGTISYAYQWRRDGSPISGATSDTYTLQAGDDGATVSCRVTATDDNGSAFEDAAGVSVTYAAPVAAGGLDDQIYTQGSGDQTVDASADFTGAVGGSWSVTGTGASIDSAGLVTITTDDLRSGSIVTVTYTNSGGADSTAFQVTVQEEAADAVTFDSTATRFDSTLITFDRSA